MPFSIIAIRSRTSSSRTRAQRNGLDDRQRNPADYGDDRNPQRRNPQELVHIRLQELVPELIRLDGRHRCFTSVA